MSQWKTNRKTRQPFPFPPGKYVARPWNQPYSGRLEDVDPRTPIDRVVYPSIRDYLLRHGFKEVGVAKYKPDPDERYEHSKTLTDKEDRIYFEDENHRGVEVPVKFTGRVFLTTVATRSDITQDILDNDPYPSSYFKHPEQWMRVNVNTLRKFVELNE